MPSWSFETQASAPDYDEDDQAGQALPGTPIGLLLALTFPVSTSLLSWDNEAQSAAPSFTPETQN